MTRAGSEEIRRLLVLLDAELVQHDILGELYLVGGAVMCLAPSARGDFDPYLELAHLRVFTARPEYLLAMKCAAMRLGEAFHDLDDVRFLLRYLNVTTADDAMRIVTQYFDERHLLPKTRLALEELLGG